MSQSATASAVAAASLGAPRRHRDIQEAPTVGTSISARFGDSEWEAREVISLQQLYPQISLQDV